MLADITQAAGSFDEGDGWGRAPSESDLRAMAIAKIARTLKAQFPGRSNAENLRAARRMHDDMEAEMVRRNGGAA